MLAWYFVFYLGFTVAVGGAVRKWHGHAFSTSGNKQDQVCQRPGHHMMITSFFHYTRIVFTCASASFLVCLLMTAFWNNVYTHLKEQSCKDEALSVMVCWQGHCLFKHSGTLYKNKDARYQRCETALALLFIPKHVCKRSKARCLQDTINYFLYRYVHVINYIWNSQHTQARKKLAYIN